MVAKVMEFDILLNEIYFIDSALNSKSVELCSCFTLEYIIWVAIYITIPGYNRTHCIKVQNTYLALSFQ